MTSQIYLMGQNGNVYAFDSEEDVTGFAPDGAVRMTAVEVDQYLGGGDSDAARLRIERQRLYAYADPVDGSDRLFTEASRISLMGLDGYEEAIARAVERFKEIQAAYPWPEE